MAPGGNICCVKRLRPAQCDQGFKQGRQGLFPATTAFEGGFDLRQRQRPRRAGQQMRHGFDLLGQRGRPGLRAAAVVATPKPAVPTVVIWRQIWPSCLWR